MRAKLSAIVLILTVFFVSSGISYGCHNPPPTVYITHPTDGDAFTEGDSILITANASDNGSITKVTFYVDSQPEVNDFNLPYGYTKYNVQHGSYTLKARAYDNLGAWTDSAAVDINVGVIRFVDIDSPAIEPNRDGTCWNQAYKYLQDALADANAGDELRVAQGTYQTDTNTAHPDGTNNRNASFQLINNVDVKGSYAGYGEPDPNARNIVEHKTILSGDINEPNDANDNSYHVVIGADNAVLDGLIITGGDANGSDSNSFGGGMYNDGSSPTIIDCVLSSNHAYEGGGGIYNKFCYPTVTKCVLSENDANYGGAIYDQNSCPRLINCTISRNSANSSGGGIYNNHSYPIITNSIIWGNTVDSIDNDNRSYDLDNDSNLVSWWKFDEGTGSVAYDSKGNNDGNIYDASWVIGRFDDALSFDGENDYTDMNDPAGGSLDFGSSDSFTFSVWFKCNTLDGQHSLISKREVISGVHNEGYSWRIYNNKLDAGIEGTNTIGTAITGNTTISINQWYHAVFVRNAAADKLYLYLNGVSDALPVTDLTTTTLANTYHFMIGRWEYYNLYFDGLIDDVRVYNRALTEEEIRLLSGVVRYSDIEGCGGSSAWDPNFGVDGGGNIDNDPLFADVNNPAGSDGVFVTADDGLRLMPDSPCVDAADGDIAPSGDILGRERFDNEYVNNTGTGEPNYADIGAYEVVETESIVYNVTKHLFYSTIQLALNDADAFDYIKVYPGTYYEKIDFNDSSCTLASMDPNDPNVVAATIINARDTNSSSYVVKFDSTEDANSILDGFTITGGYYGIFCSSSSPVINNCTIENNKSVGVLINNYSSPEITGCTISGNMSTGVSCERSSPVISQCDIVGNRGTGISATYLSSPVISRCRIIRNGSSSSTYGISFYSYQSSGSGTIENCVIAKNYSRGILLVSRPSTVTNCTVYGNGGGYGIYSVSQSAAHKIKNCILWNNGTELYHCNAGYSCTEDDNAGLGNFKIYPNFKNIDANDFHLENWSRCIDSGDPNSDYSNEPNSDDPNINYRINMGAYGNTEEAETLVDENSDGLPEGWLQYYWPGYDPNSPNYAPGGDPDVDDFNNLVEYLFGYNPNLNTNENMKIIVGLSDTKFDPTQGEKLKVIYLLNMDANVTTTFTDIDTSEVVRTLDESVTAGRHEAEWNGQDTNSEIILDGFYNISIDADDGDGNSTDYNAGSVEAYYVHAINNLACNPFRILPMNNEISKITYNLTVDANMIVTVYDPCGALFATLVDDELQTVASNPQEVIWYGRDKEPNDPNSRYISKEGSYLVRVRFAGMREKEKSTIWVYK